MNFKGPKITVGLSQINNSFSGANYLPYSVGLLQAYIKKHIPGSERFNFLQPVFKRIPVDDAVDHLESAEIAGFSLYVWNEQISLEIMRRLKKRNPKTYIICGGPQVPDQAESFLRQNPEIDIVAHGEGERTFLELLKKFPSKEINQTPGTSHIDDSGKFFNNPKADRIKDLSIVPSPYLSGEFDSLMQSMPDEEWLILWETNRGCPFPCTFCDWGSAVADRVFRFDMNRIYEELDWFSKNKIEFIFNCDANFGILPRDVDIAQRTVKNKNQFGYPKVLSTQNTKNATERNYLTQKILADNGLNKGVTLSMQSLFEPALRNIKRQNISIKTYEELQRRFNFDNIATYSDFILGLPGETYESFVDGVATLIQNGQHNRIQFNNLSVLPNAEMGNPEYQKQYGMELVNSKILNIHGSRECSENDIEEIQKLVIATSSMPRDMWCKTRAFSWMTAFLHFDKLLQIPLITIEQSAGISYGTIIESFFEVDPSEFPLIAEIRDHFSDRAAVVQTGGPEYYYSKEWLGIWWPDDEYQLIRLSTEGKLDLFYEESERLLKAFLNKAKKDYAVPLVTESIKINRSLLKQPHLYDDLEIESEYNVLEVYTKVLTGQPIAFNRVKSSYRITRSTQTWADWQTWCREVVWFGNKKGDYLYGSSSLEKYYAGHY
ncbi:MAG TPA: hypothetical protein EYN05_09305 [Nitrospinaceae bacterium]|nr:hypothetical protein [Nitrospinaceae bacterium]